MTQTILPMLFFYACMSNLGFDGAQSSQSFQAQELESNSSLWGRAARPSGHSTRALHKQSSRMGPTGSLLSLGGSQGGQVFQGGKVITNSSLVCSAARHTPKSIKWIL